MKLGREIKLCTQTVLHLQSTPKPKKCGLWNSLLIYNIGVSYHVSGTIHGESFLVDNSKESLVINKQWLLQRFCSIKVFSCSHFVIRLKVIQQSSTFAAEYFFQSTVFPLPGRRVREGHLDQVTIYYNYSHAPRGGSLRNKAPGQSQTITLQRFLSF